MSEPAGANSERHPVVSVVMSVYNGMPHLVPALESLEAQTFRDVEFVIVNDGSSDGSRDALLAFAARDPRVRLIEQENSGLTRALVRGVDEARGELIARMDADDLSVPERIERQVALLRASPSAVAATCALRCITHDDSELVRFPVEPPELIPWYLTFFNAIGGHGQIMFRKSTYLAAGGYNPEFRYAQDYDLWVRLTKFGPIATQREPLYQYRISHSESISVRHRPAQDDCALRISGRAYVELTGLEASRELSEQLRLFWTSRQFHNLPSRDVAAVSAALDAAFAAYFRVWPQLRCHRPKLRSMIAERWIEAAKLASFRHPGFMLNAFQRAAMWSIPGTLAAVARIAKRRVGKSVIAS